MSKYVQIRPKNMSIRITPYIYVVIRRHTSEKYVYTYYAVSIRDVCAVTRRNTPYYAVYTSYLYLYV